MEARSRFRKLLPIAIVCAALLVAGSVTFHMTAAQDNPHGEKAIRTRQLDAFSQAFTRVARDVSPAVVFITVQRVVETPQYRMWGPFWEFEEFFPGLPDLFRHRRGADPRRRLTPRMQPKRVVTGQGSGVIVSEDGYILTANHVVGDADIVWVKLAGKKQYKAEVVGTDPTTDIALVKIDVDDLPYAALGDSDELEVGQWVLAIGNPAGLEQTVTQGIVSGTGRKGLGLTRIENYIQTTAPINFGNSGGPLVNLRGEVVGINTAIKSRQAGYEGIGFAVPVNIAKRSMRQLKETGESSWGYLGVVPGEVDPDLAEHLGITGIEMLSVEEDSPADRGGLEAGDIVVRYDGQQVDNVDQFRELVANTKPGSTVKIEVLRSGKRESLKVTVGSWSQEGEAVARGEAGRIGLGFEVQEVTRQDSEELGFDGREGLLVTSIDPDSEAYAKGLRSGQLIIEINYESVKRIAQLEREVKKAREGDEKVILTVMTTDGWIRTLLLSP